MKYHIVVKQWPISQHGQDQEAICGEIVRRAVPATIVPEVCLAPVEMLASSFGTRMCGDCQLHRIPDGEIYFMCSQEDAAKLRMTHEYAEVS